MKPNLFKDVASSPNNPDWSKHTQRQTKLYELSDDIRTPCERDYTRILHSMTYRRLKHNL